MNLLNAIPIEKYNDTQYCYDFLNDNKIIGNENTEYNGIFHLHWRGTINNNKILLQIKSILATQKVKYIYIWIEDYLRAITSPGYANLIQFRKYVKFKIFDKKVLDLIDSPTKIKNKIIQYYEGGYGDYRYKTDIFRWIILSIYGGVYTDADTFLLRDLRELKIKNWSSKWGINDYAEACILKLEKGSKIYEQMYLNDPKNPQCFLNIGNSNYPQAYSFKHKNLDFTVLPSVFFDIVWNEGDNETLDFLTINQFNKFFLETDKDIKLDTFFKGCFAYHWHNQWDALELKNSVAGKLNQDLDKIIKDKYNIISAPIFTS